MKVNVSCPSKFLSKVRILTLLLFIVTLKLLLLETVQTILLSGVVSSETKLLKSKTFPSLPIKKSCGRSTTGALFTLGSSIVICWLTPVSASGKGSTTAHHIVSPGFVEEAGSSL